MPENDLRILNWLLTTNPGQEPKKFNSVVDWKRHNAKYLAPWTEPVDRAIAGGFLADCPANAFAAGYWAALHRLLPDLPPNPVSALCISEEHGTHPAGIKCRLEKQGAKWWLNGKKHFVTCGREAELLVVASTGIGSDGKNQLRLVKVNKEQAGITLLPLARPLTILPEISHGQIEFTKVSVSPDNILPGDGYLDYIKPFRTIEDLHVMAAILGYLVRIGILFEWPRAPIEQLLAHLVTTWSLARADYAAPEIHIATAGTLAAIWSLLETLDDCWERADDALRSAWRRDRTVLNIAADARTARLAAAWRQFA